MRRGRVTDRTVLLVASFGAFLAFLDATIVNVAFPSIRASFDGSSISSLSWILNAYNIVFAAFLVISGRLADLAGRRRAFLSGVLVFTAASAMCAMAGSVGLLVGARMIQALGAAILVPASLALVVEAFPAHRRAHAVGLWGASAALASGLGPPIGGALVEAGGWRWAFLVNLPFGLAALWAGRRLLVESRAPGRRRLPDLKGAVLSAAMLGLLTLGIVKGNDWGWTSWQVLGCFAGAGLLFAGFVVSSRRHRSPLLDPALLRIRSFAVGNLAMIIAGMGFYAYLLTNILWLQYVWGYSVLRAGLALVPAALVAAVLAAVLGPVAEKRGYRLVIIPGALVWALAYLWYATRVGSNPRLPRPVAARAAAQRARGGSHPAGPGQRVPGRRPRGSVRHGLGGQLQRPADRSRPRHRDPRRHHRHADPDDRGHGPPARLGVLLALFRGRGHRGGSGGPGARGARPWQRTPTSTRRPSSGCRTCRVPLLPQGQLLPHRW